MTRELMLRQVVAEAGGAEQRSRGNDLVKTVANDAQKTSAGSHGI